MRPGHKYGPNSGALLAEQRPGRCCVCDELLVPPLRVVCREKECLKVRQAAFDADRYAKRLQRMRERREAVR